MYTVEFLPKAERFLKRQNAKTADLIAEKIDALAANPFAPNNNVIKLVGEEGYRLRVGNIRVMYRIHNNVLTIVVFNMGFRGDIYKGGSK